MIATPIQLLVIGAACVCGLMLILWLIHLLLKNAAIVDAGWAGGLALLAVIDAAMGGGYRLRAVCIATMAALWGLRLAFYLLFTRVIGQPEEGRYVQLRREWGGNIAFKFLLFFEFQAFLCIALSLPFLIAAINPRPGLSTMEYVAMGLWLLAWIGESTADFQLMRFKANIANRGGIC